MKRLVVLIWMARWPKAFVAGPNVVVTGRAIVFEVRATNKLRAPKLIKIVFIWLCLTLAVL